MISTDLIALYAAAVASFALALEVRRWFEEGVRLSINAHAGMIVVPDHFADKKQYLVVRVSNHGTRATTLTAVGLNEYPSLWARLTNSPTFSAVMGVGPSGLGQGLPHKLEPGTQWMGFVEHNDEIERLLIRGDFFVSIRGTHAARDRVARVRDVRQKK